MFLAEAAKEGEGMEHYTVEQLIVTLIDFFTGGSGTMSEKTQTLKPFNSGQFRIQIRHDRDPSITMYPGKTLSSALLFCLTCPRAMDAVRDELSTINGEVFSP